MGEVLQCPRCNAPLVRSTENKKIYTCYFGCGTWTDKRSSMASKSRFAKENVQSKKTRTVKAEKLLLRTQNSRVKG